jgi:oligosaccharide repeat unit polymerase
LILVLIGDAQRHYRDAGELNASVSVRIEDNDFFTFTAFAMAVSDELGTTTGDNALWNILAGPVPRALWEDKPEPETVFVFSYYMWGIDVTQRGGNTLPSIVGQAYISHGTTGVVLTGLILGLLLSLCDKAIRRASLSSQIVYATFAMYIFLAFRILGFGFFTVFALFLVLVRFAPRAATAIRVPARISTPRPVAAVRE